MPAMMHKTLETVDNLERIRPADDLAVRQGERHGVHEKTGRCIVVHEAAKTGEFAAKLIASINNEVLMYISIERVTGFDIPIPLLSMENFYILTRPGSKKPSRANYPLIFAAVISTCCSLETVGRSNVTMAIDSACGSPDSSRFRPLP